MYNIIEKLKSFDLNSVILFNQIKNNIVNESYFIKIHYSKMYFTLNGIYIHIPFVDVFFENIYSYKMHIDINKNKYVIKKLKEIEVEILKRASITNKNVVYKIQEQLKGGFIKIFLNNNNNNNNDEKRTSSSSTSCSQGSQVSQDKKIFGNSSNFYSSSSKEEKKTEQTRKISLPYLFEDREKNNFCQTQSIQPNIMLKISGIWITENDYGLSYKFLIFTPLKI